MVFLYSNKNKERIMVDLKYIGHSAFEFKTGDKSILVDPLVSINPKYDYKESNIVDIFVSDARNNKPYCREETQNPPYKSRKLDNLRLGTRNIPSRTPLKLI